jgi:hypothetical protein
MKKLTSLLATSVLVLSLSGVALADGDGGNTHGPGLPTSGPPVQTPSLEASADDQYYAAASDLTLLIVWLESIL